ncbi:hypothetical protein [Streptacidiphilus melanogenes]|uniref:hypothetical protein n=1 Tax=Streptacidiphilus melanogenes TaxID=411235 RepID=UPI0005A7B14D|nr:hypothetical protein [Streptacidiphilus melanogenes]
MRKDLLPLIVVMAGFLALFLVQRGRTSLYHYQCTHCGESFGISPLLAALAHHRMGQKLLRCPSCGAVTWARPVRKG